MKRPVKASLISSFLKGSARLADMFGSLNTRTTRLTPAQLDYLALKSDWEVVGQDMYHAISQFEKTLKRKLHGRKTKR